MGVYRQMEYRNGLIDKANRSLNIKMGGNGDYLEKDIDIEVVRKILKNDAKENIVTYEGETNESDNVGNRKSTYNKVTNSNSRILTRINKLSRNIAQKIETTFK